MEYPLFIDNFFSWLVIGFFTLNLLVALIVFLPLVIRKKETLANNGELPPISVIVVARNEFENLTELLP
ncbi:MAG: hypothetical protein KDC92_16050, partial [Bacteroidetes bacterium]|nr:hypothetical protein [Bacteroidota bacterium]